MTVFRSSVGSASRSWLPSVEHLADLRWRGLLGRGHLSPVRDWRVVAAVGGAEVHPLLADRAGPHHIGLGVARDGLAGVELHRDLHAVLDELDACDLADDHTVVAGAEVGQEPRGVLEDGAHGAAAVEWVAQQADRAVDDQRERGAEEDNQVDERSLAHHAITPIRPGSRPRDRSRSRRPADSRRG